ncbi:DUF5722 domain-containing protein [Paenibacillus spongiae]|uniref:DUF5722 domain-containing protein n=1 Tax=Paenibacillus spongiae TaxID=2909671 RepID=A0ABY5S9G3_9BACL|nr:DUF5722 domain-containing protein [Paenibacillus spongiae]UVI28948.1 DUF5722 domain-containing protein [Paenibacillus spongiae]
MKRHVKVTSGALALALLLQIVFSSVTAFAGAYEPDLKQSGNVFNAQEFFPNLIINDFNTAADVATWQKGANTKSVNYATSILNGPGGPYEGDGTLEQIPEKVKVYQWRTIYRDFSAPLDLSGQRYLAFAANSWGWQPVDYMFKVRLYSGEDVYESVAKISNDRWNRVFIDISGWAQRGAVTKMELSFMQNFDLAGIAPGAPGYDSWDGRFQIDYIIATNTLDMRFSRDGDAEGFTASQGSVNASGGKATFGIGGAGDYIESPVIQIDAGIRNGMSVALDNMTSGSKVKLAWITEEDPTWDDAKTKLFDLAPNANAQTVDFNMWDKANWSGTIKQFRILAPADSGSIVIDEIRFKNFPPAEVPYDGAITAQINDSGSITINGSVKPEYAAEHSEDDLVLFELPTYADAGNLTGLTPLAEQDIAAEFSFDVSLKDGSHNRLYSKFAVASRNGAGELKLMDAPQYITNAEKLAPNREPYPEAKSIKGLQVQMTDDAEELGVSHAAINVSYNGMLYLANTNPGNTIPYVVDGETFYFKKDYVSHLDSQIKSLSDNDTIVNLILLMYRDLSANTPNSHLIHPDSQPGGIVYALNTQNEMGVKYVKAVTTFLADRYSQPDEAYGRAVGFIVGNEVGQNQVWNNMGPKTVNKYVREYAQTLRLVDTIVKSRYANARSYISLDHFWNEELPSDALWKYDNKVIVDMLNKLAQAEGDFSWNMAFHPYPENLFDARFWNDQTPTNDFNTVRITFKNLQVLVQYLQQQDFLYEGNMRRIILSEQGLNSMTDSQADQRIQAAAYAYAYYKIKFLDGIDSFILHRHVDHEQEGGLNLGLWTAVKNSISSPNAHKLVYDVFKYIDTDKSLETTDFAKSVIGIANWEDVIPGFDPSALADRDLPSQSGVSFITEANNPLLVEGFENGAGAWHAADNASSIAVADQDAFKGTRALKINFSDYSALNWKGADVRFPEPVDAAQSPNLTFAMKLPGADASKTYYGKVKVYSGKNITEGTVLLDPQGWNHIALNLADWSGVTSIDRIKVWVSSPVTQPWTGSFLLDEIGFHESVVVDGTKGNIDIVTKLLSPELKVGAQVEVTVTNRGSQTLDGEVAVSGKGHLGFDSSALQVSGIQAGESRKFVLTVTSYTPPSSGAISAAFSYGGWTVEKVLGTVKETGEGSIPENEKLLFNFEGSTQGWTAKTNLVTPTVVESFPNGPTKPMLGSYALNARSVVVAATAWKTFEVAPATPIDLSAADQFFYHINSYGGVPNATYETKVTLYSGSESITTTVPMGSDKWNRISLSVADWAHNAQVTRIEISFRAVGNSLAWNPEIQLDYIGYTKAAPKKVLSLRTEQKYAVLKPNQPIAMKVYALYEDGKEKEISGDAGTVYQSSNTNVVGVAGQALQTGSVEGTSVVTVAYGGQQAKFLTVVDKSDLKSIIPSAFNVQLKPNASATLQLQAVFMDGTRQDVTDYADWTSNVPKLATVQGSTITAVKVGNVIITVRFADKANYIMVNIKS